MALVPFPEEDKPEYILFDLVERDISEIEIKQSYHGNCYITDGNKYYSGFILNKKKDSTQTCCEITFYKSSETGLWIPRLTFYKVKAGNNELKDSRNPEKVRIAFDSSSEGIAEFWKMMSFLFNYKDLVDTGEFNRKYKAVGIDDIVIQLKDLEEPERIMQIVQYALRSGVTLESLAGTALHTERQKALRVFERLLTEDGFVKKYWDKYKAEIKGVGNEAVWHYFLKKNHWILGLNLDIRFIKDFTDEVSVGNPDTENRDNPKVDLMGLSDYTVLVELKTPETDIFTDNKQSSGRAGTWTFTPDFIDGFSQCLAQKSHWDKESKGKDLVKDGQIINQEATRTVDPKTIYIVGSKKRELPISSTLKETVIKRDTFERFRRNNRNVEIITFDELYERANFIVNGKTSIQE